tara:strand:+ start:132 stop:485 length:354 start_codon:yes stop_codon:yes gene_type:complete
MDELKLQRLLKKFCEERHWQEFHTLRNIATALSVEASELLEIFQWMNKDLDLKKEKEIKNQISDEVADIMLYLLRFCDLADIDLETACAQKIKKNKKKYPVKLAKGKSTKYNKLKKT